MRAAAAPMIDSGKRHRDHLRLVGGLPVWRGLYCATPRYRARDDHGREDHPHGRAHARNASANDTARDAVARGGTHERGESMETPGARGHPIGASVRRREDARLITGRGRYVSDIALPGMIHVAFVRSLHAHARLRAIDVTAARTAPGVVGIVTGGTRPSPGIGSGRARRWRPTSRRISRYSHGRECATQARR
jgi:Aldehyde oxidase and xanthine dehydrogenase, a/b hammerhead domain